MSSVCFQVNLYDKTIDEMVDTKIPSFLNSFSGFTFTEKIIVVNNISDRDSAEHKLEKYKNEFIIKWVEEEDTQKIFNTFGVNITQTDRSFLYSMPHFLTLFYTNCEYVLHISEDVELVNVDENFIHDSIELFKTNNDLISSIPKWFPSNELIELEEDYGKMYSAFGFSDQMFLIKTNDFKKHIYNFDSPLSSRYPVYGGDCFEKRVNSYMDINKKYRLIHKTKEYKHLK